MAPRGSPRTPFGLTERTPPVRSAGINADSGLWLPGTASSSRTWSGARCSNSEVLLIGDADVRLGDLYVDGIAPVPVYISRPQFAAWEHTHLTIDAVPGRGAGFSLEAPEGVRFLTRSRLLTDEERRVEVS